MFYQSSLFDLLPTKQKEDTRTHIDDVKDWWLHNKWEPVVGLLTGMPVISYYGNGESCYTSCEIGYINEINGDMVVVCCKGRRLIIGYYECEPLFAYYPYTNEKDYRKNILNQYKCQSNT